MLDYLEEIRKTERIISEIELINGCSIETLVKKMCEDIPEDDTPKKKLVIQYDAILSKQDLECVRDSIRKQLKEDNFVLLDGRFKIYEADAVEVR